MEKELVSGIGNEFQMVGPRSGILKKIGGIKKPANLTKADKFKL